MLWRPRRLLQPRSCTRLPSSNPSGTAILTATLQQTPRRAAFEEGVAAAFTQWTALCLAVENEWGGPHSVDKANQIIQDVIDWFYGRKGAAPHALRMVTALSSSQLQQRCSGAPPPTPSTPTPSSFPLTKTEYYVDDLEIELDAAMTQDFNTECEDGSPRQVAITLVELHNQLLRGDTALLDHLRSRQASGAGSSKRQVVDLDGAEIEGGSSSSDDDGDDDSMDGDEDGAAPAAVALAAAQQQPAARPQPVVDEDGFELVQGRRGRR